MRHNGNNGREFVDSNLPDVKISDAGIRIRLEGFVYFNVQI